MSIPSFKLRLAALAAVAIVPLGALTACDSSDSANASSPAALKDGFGGRATNRNVEFITYYDPSQDAFWNQIKQGADDAAQVSQLTLKAETAAGETGKMTDLINASAASKPAALVIPFNDPAWENAACEASKAGVAVFAYNVPPTGPAKDCVKAFVGQDFVEVGKLVGQKLVESVELSAGDKVLCPAEEPSQQYAIQRGGGVESVLKAKGVKCTYLRTSGEDAPALDKMQAWLTANKDVKAIVPLGGTPHRNAVQAEDAAGVKVPIVGFDTSPQVISGIKSGRIIATADQQGYVQGFQPVMEAALFLDFGLSPANVNSGGNSLIDKSTVTNLEDKALQGVRW
ncbi:simple sugar transport system substrate-binding protein [Kribbella antiqua]|uniref:Simple sugar transport system substrate-binding protein n=1 Tax=Kribbella antiqua TaxID=2512217 RepID=A0A4R2J534_9ACTN|nr:substrate-binding domain-containing protein [Kribbella antiqua]TCO50345.1 simple sugar transport system substrate-binding protein [Kribbella antiqua]